MMKLKKSWKDRQGVGALVIGIVIVVIALIAVVAVVMAMPYITGDGKGPGWYDPGADKDEDGEEQNPIFGYLDMSIQLRFDNSGTGNYVIYGIVPNTLTATVGGSAPTAQAFHLLDWFQAHNCAYTLDFKVVSPQLGYNAPINKVVGQQDVGAAQNLVTPPIHNTASFALRDHGMYEITVTLYDGGGKLVSSANINAEL